MEGENKLPGFFDSLHTEEEKVNKKTIECILNDKDLKNHLDILYVSANIILEFIRNYQSSCEEELIIQFLGVRLFNSVEVSLKMLLSGYYQHSASVTRDILEVGYLLDYFSLFPKEIMVWKTCGEKEHKRRYNQASIREALDKRDGLTSMKRAEKYRLLCMSGTHATYQGLKLLAPNNMVTPGPFFCPELIKPSLEELVNNATYVTVIFMNIFKNQNIINMVKVISFFEPYSMA